MYDCPGAALPNPMFLASVTVDTLLNDAPELVEWYSPPVSPANQMSPSRPGIALNFAVVGSPVAAAVKLCPPLVLM